MKKLKIQRLDDFNYYKITIESYNDPTVMHMISHAGLIKTRQALENNNDYVTYADYSDTLLQVLTVSEDLMILAVTMNDGHLSYGTVTLDIQSRLRTAKMFEQAELDYDEALPDE